MIVSPYTLNVYNWDLEKISKDVQLWIINLHPNIDWCACIWKWFYCRHYNRRYFAMSVQQIPSNSKVSKSKRPSMNRPQSTIDGDIYAGIRSEVENETMAPAYRSRLHNLFRQIEKEFDLLYQENQSCKYTYTTKTACKFRY